MLPGTSEERCPRHVAVSATQLSGETVYIGIGTLVLVLLIVLIVMALRRTPV
jgi:uncharacterized integral membrane protein